MKITISRTTAGWTLSKKEDYDKEISPRLSRSFKNIYDLLTQIFPESDRPQSSVFKINLNFTYLEHGIYKIFIDYQFVKDCPRDIKNEGMCLMYELQNQLTDPELVQNKR